MTNLRSLTQQIYDYVADEIRFGNLEFGQKIDENELINKLQISRTPIREALIQLSAHGLLENIPRKGFFVTKVHEDTVREIYSIISCLDFFALRSAIPNLKDEDYQILDEITKKIDSAIEYKDYKAYCLLADDFHEYYHNASGNNSFQSVFDTIKALCVRHTFYTSDTERLFEVLIEVNKEHKKILELAKENNLTELEKILESHWTKEAPGMW